MSIDEYLAFINTVEFDADWHALGFGDIELSDLQSSIAADPEAGPVMAGTNGMRKIRYARQGQGKSGGVRVCYAYFAGVGVILLSSVYAKNAKANLSSAEKKEAAEQIARYSKHFGG